MASGVTGSHHGQSIALTASNRSECLGHGHVVIPQPTEPTGTVPSRLAAPVLHGGNTPAPVGTALRAVGGGKGHLLTVRVVAGRLGVSTATVYKLVAQGDLPHLRVSNAIRVAPTDLDSYIAQCRGLAGDRKENP